MGNRKKPILSETVKKIRAIIQSNIGARLPSVRNLARQCTVSPVTVLKALKNLKAEGLLEGGWGRGYCIVDKKPKGSGSQNADYQNIKKVEKTVRMIKNDIIEGKYQTNQPLPLIKYLMSIYNVSYPTIRKALVSLKEEKIIKRSGSRYYFFTDHARPLSRIAIVAFGLGRGSIKVVTERECNFYRLLSAAAIENNVLLETVCYNDYLPEPKFYTSDDTPIAKYLESRSITGIILSSYHMKDSAECLRRLLTFNIPISVWVEDHRILKMIGFCGSQRKKLSFFDSSYSTLPGVEVGRYLIGKGHRRIAYISPFHKSQWSQNRLKGLQKAASSVPDALIYPFVNNKYLNDYFFLKKVHGESAFDEHCTIRNLTGKLHTFLKKKISSVKYEYELLLRDNMIFAFCKELMKKALKNSSITAWVCANDHISVLITDYWNSLAIPFERRPALIGFDNSFESFKRNISSYEFNTRGEIQQMLNCVLYPNSLSLPESRPSIRLSGRVVERGSTSQSHLFSNA